MKIRPKAHQDNQWRRSRAVLKRYIPAVRAEILRRLQASGRADDSAALLRMIHRYDNGKL